MRHQTTPRGRKGLAGLLLGAALLAAALVPSGAAGATTIGSSLRDGATYNTIGGEGALSIATLTADPLNIAAGGLTAPHAGVVVRWRVGPLDATPAKVSLRVIAGNQGAGTAEAVQLERNAGIQTFPARLPIAAGSRLGLTLVPPDPSALTFMPTIVGIADKTDLWGHPALVDGVSNPPVLAMSGISVALNADIEADADGDGFGDESQDGCPTDAAKQGPCVTDKEPDPPDTDAPETSLAKTAPAKTTKHKVSFEFVADEPGSSFECRLDATAWSGCTSPKRIKHLKHGRHAFEVRATDAAGNVDPTPAKQRFRVKRD